LNLERTEGRGEKEVEERAGKRWRSTIGMNNLLAGVNINTWGFEKEKY